MTEGEIKYLTKENYETMILYKRRCLANLLSSMEEFTNPYIKKPLVGVCLTAKGFGIFLLINVSGKEIVTCVNLIRLYLVETLDLKAYGILMGYLNFPVA